MVLFHVIAVETVYPRKKEIPKGFLDAVVGDTKRQVESKRVEDVVSSGSVELDLRRAIEVCHLHLLKHLVKPNHANLRRGIRRMSLSIYHCMIALSTLSYSPIGKIKLFTSQLRWQTRLLI